MPNIESDNDEDNDVYYLGETDKQEYLENFKFKKNEEDEASVIKKILKNSTTSVANSNDSLASKSSSKEDVSSTKDTRDEEETSNSNNNISESSNDKSSTESKKDTKSLSDITSEDTKNSSISISKSSLSKKSKNVKANKKEIELDEEDQTEARYNTMKMNEKERKEKMEKARQRREMIRTKDNGKFSKSALLSLLQQYGESLSAELFEQYISELLKDNSSNYNQLEEFFTLDDFVSNVLSFEEELLPETRIEKLNRESNNDTEITTTNHTISTDSHSAQSQIPVYKIGSHSAWMDNENENDTEPYYVYTE